MRAAGATFRLKPAAAVADTSNMAPSRLQRSSSLPLLLALLAASGLGSAQAVVASDEVDAAAVIAQAAPAAGTPRARRPSAQLPLPLGSISFQELSPRTLAHARLGWSRQTPQRLRGSTWSLGIEAAGALTATADLYGDERARPVFGAGIGWVTGEQVRAKLSLVRPLDGQRVPELRLGLTLGF